MNIYWTHPNRYNNNTIPIVTPFVMQVCLCNRRIMVCIRKLLRFYQENLNILETRKLSTALDKDNEREKYE